MEWYFILIIALGAVILLLFALALTAYKIAFGARCDKNPLLKYFSAEELGIKADGFPLGWLYGCIYEDKTAEKKQEVVVFVHGLGPGQCAYMTEIAYFCRLGYTVIAVDSLGCGGSQGKNIRGMYEGVRTAIAAVNFAKKQFAGSKIYLIGHSWGGYSALCSSAEIKVDKVVAISAPLTPAKTIYSGARGIISAPLAFVLRPFWGLIDFFNFGFKGNKNSAKCAEKSGAKTLLVQGDCDSIVPMNNSAYFKASGANIEKLLAAGKAHNPYASLAAQKLLIELNAKLAVARKMNAEELKYFEVFDFLAATEEDEEIMRQIADFLN